jgi:predicted outer membrane lipoprotein
MIKEFVWMLGIVLLIAAAFAIAQNKAPEFVCHEGVCYMTEKDAERVANALNWAAKELRKCGAI